MTILPPVTGVVDESISVGSETVPARVPPDILIVNGPDTAVPSVTVATNGPPVSGIPGVNVAWPLAVPLVPPVKLTVASFTETVVVVVAACAAAEIRTAILRTAGVRNIGLKLLLI